MSLRTVAVGVVLALVAVGCEQLSQAPEPTLAEYLVALRDSGAQLGGVTVRSDDMLSHKQQGFVVRDGVTQHVVFAPDAPEPQGIDLAVATIPWSVANPYTIASQVDQLSTVCSDSYTVEVKAATATALISTVSCSGATMGSSKALLNGKQFPAMSGKWAAEDWQALLDEWAILAESGTIISSTISRDEITTSLAPADRTHDCDPRISQSLDGSDVNLGCVGLPYFQQPASFAGLTGSGIAAATASAMSDAGMTTTDVEYGIRGSDWGYMVLDIRSGALSTSVLLKPATSLDPMAPPTLASRLTLIRESAAYLGNIHIQPNGADAWILRDDWVKSASLLPELSEPEYAHGTVAVTDWNVINPAAIAGQVEHLAKVCPDSYSVWVKSATASAYIATVACSGRERTSKAYLNQKPFQAISKWDSADWKHLLDEWTVLAPTKTLGGVSFDGIDFRVWLSPRSLGACPGPILVRSADGLAVSFRCSGVTDRSFSFADLTADELAAAVSKARTKAGDTDAPVRRINLGESNGKLKLFLKIGQHYYEEILN